MPDRAFVAFLSGLTVNSKSPNQARIFGARPKQSNIQSPNPLKEKTTLRMPLQKTHGPRQMPFAAIAPNCLLALKTDWRELAGLGERCDDTFSEGHSRRLMP